MRVLVTGGTGVIGAGVLPELIAAGHSVRLLSRHANDDARRYPENVEPFRADVADAKSLRSAADNCEAIVHIAGIVDESPPNLTFDKVNLAGTQNILAEANRAGVQRFIFISTLGADRGKSKYQQSKLAAERLITSSSLRWTVLRPGNVYGPGDEVISMLLKLARSVPALPVVGSGDQRFQPIWFEDMGKAVVRSLDEKFAHQTLELAGAEVTTTREVIELIGSITDRPAKAVSVPEKIVSAVAQTAERAPIIEQILEKAGLHLPITTNKLQMLLEENFISEGRENGLTRLLQVEPTPLEEGLRRLANELPELLPEDGVGATERKNFTATINGAAVDARALMRDVRENLAELMPLEFKAEPLSEDRVQPNATLTGEIPGRGHFQMRVAEVTDNQITMLTVEGHPIAGMVTIRSEDTNDGDVAVTIETVARAATLIDWIAMRSFGRILQNQNWRSVVDNIVRLSGGAVTGEIVVSTERLGDEQADEVNDRAQHLAEAISRREFASR